MEIVVVVIVLALVVFPMWKIVLRSGLNPLWTLLVVAPFGVIVLLWMIALRPWPGERA